MPQFRVLFLDVMIEDHILALIKRVADIRRFVTETLNNTPRFMTTFARFKSDIGTLYLVMPYRHETEIIRWLGDVDLNIRLSVCLDEGLREREQFFMALADGSFC